MFAADMWAFLNIDAWPLLLLWFALGIVPKGGIASFNHHHQHLNMFLSAPANRMLEFILGLQTGIVSHAWVLHHSVGHHVNYLDQHKDESRWRWESGRVMTEAEYVLWGGIVAYPRALAVGSRFPKYRRALLLMSLVTTAFLAVCFVYRPLQTLTVFVAPMVFGVFFTVWATYTHHTGKRVDSHYVACNNIVHAGYNWLTGNLGYHTAHHAKPGVHWSKLPALHQTMAHLIPADCYLSPGLPWHFGQKVVGPPPGMPFALGTSVDESLQKGSSRKDVSKTLSESW